MDTLYAIRNTQYALTPKGWLPQGSRFNVQTVFKRSLETLFSNGVQTFEHLLKMVLTHGHPF
jgi:hypothetical protein